MTKSPGHFVILVLLGGTLYGSQESGLRAGEGVVEITPPVGTELAGFHKPPGQERRATGVRLPTFVRALCLAAGRTEAAVVSLDVCAVSLDFSRRVRGDVAARTGIPAENVRLCATHTHSAPTLKLFKQWGGMPKEYADLVAGRVVEAVALARKDLAPAELRLGKARVAGGNFNRTAKAWKTDEAFDKSSTDDGRWLDTTLHALHFARAKGSLLWYQFSAHPVCYTDGNAGPDWPGLVAENVKKSDGLSPSFLQGHCGDVNPGEGKPWLGDAEKVADAVADGIRRAVKDARPVAVGEIRSLSGEFAVPLDGEAVKKDLERYRADPAACTKGEWVDARFAKEWFETASAWDLSKGEYATPLSALRLGDVAVVFHSGELYSVYGLTIRRDSPFKDTIVVGYADDLIGYVPDPKAYAAGEYAALVVPKILDLPRFKPDVGRRLTAAALELLRKL